MLKGVIIKFSRVYMERSPTPPPPGKNLLNFPIYNRSRIFIFVTGIGDGFSQRGAFDSLSRKIDNIYKI